MYSDTGRPSIAPERLPRDQIDLRLGFRWFVGLSANDRVWDASTFSKNRERLLGADVAREFLESTLVEARRNAAGMGSRGVCDSGQHPRRTRRGRRNDRESGGAPAPQRD